MIGVVVPEIKCISYILEKCTFKQINKNIYKCTYYNKEFLIIITGYGKVNIALNINYILDNYDILYFISLGIIACRPCNNLNLLDIIIPLKTSQINKEVTYQANKKINNKILNSLKYTNNNYYERNIYTSEEIFPKLIKNINFIDYDLGVIGEVCNNKKIPFTGIKILTFFLNNNNQYYFYNEKALIKSNKIFLEFLIT